MSCTCRATKHPPCSFCESGGFTCVVCNNESTQAGSYDKGDPICMNCTIVPCESCGNGERLGDMLSRDIGHVCYNCDQKFIEDNGCMAGFDCKKVNIGLMFDKWVCKHCGKDME